ncbi:hypothetical protein ACRALDRAFT_1074709 [Sodiomyces alcalophilus JCM 7366]|uniref:uncharacterized protein n=1 Tax=Sodiomyces alcalophilus JCM 7366 TaxID=591952 RepID=UPI0039B46638
MAPDRQTIMETNRSLRTIKNELENLLQKGVIDDDVYENIHSLLPAEAPLRGTGPRATPSQQPNPTSPPPPTEAMANMNLKKAHDDASNTRSSHSPAPPPYTQNTGAAATATAAPPPAPSKPVLVYARGLYRYNGTDARDLAFERDDKIAVHEYMNADWWMGRNLRTGQEGIFPRNYVAVENQPPPPPQRHQQPEQQRTGPAPVQQLWPPPGPQPGYGQPGFPPPHQPHYGGPPPQQNPYHAAAPPMAVAHGHGQPPEQKGEGPNKLKDGATHVGKRLGEAAVFGAGATIGANVVNSIF